MPHFNDPVPKTQPMLTEIGDTPELKDRFPTWEDVLHADVQAIAAAIRLAGLGNQKSRTLKNFLSWLKAEHGELSLEFIHDMETEAALELLCQHKGIGIKTASVTLSFACGREVFPVDTHIPTDFQTSRANSIEL